ncbi:DNA-directed RNA polymerase subunit omega [Sporosarcina ureilytica]|uniref:DNA-directed RNA polymerase subunit omega n=1 Tax=Sporosarcina ureilytica TaxID=298596 RepID=A0A1D8JI10_9BACL|nr:DNA-directed RNA polymerase subunit omega [Sporosarcina ureilytica]AOV08314.1 DNA-directed RNA polymerase subunit omega [Sporosarcina ureilytica]
MLYPSVDSLQEKIESKYTLVTIASKRAREIQEENNKLLSSYKTKKDVGRALEEITAGVLTKKATDASVVYEDEM